MNSIPSIDRIQNRISAVNFDILNQNIEICRNNWMIFISVVKANIDQPKILKKILYFETELESLTAELQFSIPTRKMFMTQLNRLIDLDHSLIRLDSIIKRQSGCLDGHNVKNHKKMFCYVEYPNGNSIVYDLVSNFSDLNPAN